MGFAIRSMRTGRRSTRGLLPERFPRFGHELVQPGFAEQEQSELIRRTERVSRRANAGRFHSCIELGKRLGRMRGTIQRKRRAIKNESAMVADSDRSEYRGTVDDLRRRSVEPAAEQLGCRIATGPRRSGLVDCPVADVGTDQRSLGRDDGSDAVDSPI